MLARVRTGVALIGLGFVVARFGLFLRELGFRGSGQGQAIIGEHWSTLLGTLIIGLSALLLCLSYLRYHGAAPFVAVDAPFYFYDRSTGWLTSPTGPRTPGRPYAIAPDELGLLGMGQSESGNGGGVFSDLVVIPGLPFTPSTSSALRVATGHTLLNPPNEPYPELREVPTHLLAVASNGRLRLEVDGQFVVLDPGQKWERLVDAETMVEGKTAHYAVTSSVTNYGWQDRAKIGPHHP